jgi:Helix-turn-helix domain
LGRPPAPVPNRSPLRLSLAEREEISRGVAAGESLRVMARRLGRTPSTVSREVARNGGRASYRACRADRAAVGNMRRPKVAKLTRCPRLRAVVEAKLELRWSPQQIASWLVVEFPDDAEMRVSHETIYLSLFVQSGRHHHKHSTERCDDPLSPAPLWSDIAGQSGQVRSAAGAGEERGHDVGGVPVERDSRPVVAHGGAGSAWLAASWTSRRGTPAPGPSGDAAHYPSGGVAV